MDKFLLKARIEFLSVITLVALLSIDRPTLLSENAQFARVGLLNTTRTPKMDWAKVELTMSGVEFWPT